MTVTGMKEYLDICHDKYVEWYNQRHEEKISRSDVFTVWCCKTLQNYKCLVSDNVPGSGLYAEYTFNGNKGELYEDVYKKETNTCFR